jgi:hypothetical protein
MWDWLENLPYLVIAAAVVIFFVLMMGVSLLEKQRVRELEAASRDSITPTSSYFDAMNAAAEAHRYLPCGTFIRTPKTALTNAYMAAWLSPDRTIVAYVLGGKVAKVNYRKTRLISWTEEETFVETRDDFGEADHTGCRQVEVLINADFDELVRRHAERLQENSRRPRLLDPHTALMYWERMEEIRAARLVESGLARWIDQQHGVWRYTIKGGLKNFLNVVSEVKSHKNQSERLNKKRPGG